MMPAAENSIGRHGFQSNRLPAAIGMPRRKSAVLSQASAGLQSMKKHGPAPCGMYSAGMRVPGAAALAEGVGVVAVVFMMGKQFGL